MYIIFGLLAFFIITYAIHKDGCKRFPENIHPRDYFKSLSCYPKTNTLLFILCILLSPIMLLASFVCYPIIVCSTD